MNVALYCRVSTDEQARTGESILDQRQALERWANDNGHTVVGIYLDEGFSAHKSYKKRPALNRLLTDLEQGGIDLIAFTKFDRLTRKAADYYELQEILDRARVPWKAILEDYETVTADGRFKVGIMLSVNQHEAERTSERIKFTFEQKRRRGEIISGNMPKGYKLQDGKPVKDPETEPGMDAFWESYLAGSGLGASISAASAAGLHLATSTGSFILRNANAYTGRIQGVECEAYITPEQAAQVLRSRKSKAPATGAVYLFQGILFCGQCGGRMGAHRNAWRHKDGSKGFQVYYNCGRRYRTQGSECTNSVNVMELDVERRLVSVLSELIDREASRLETEIREQKRKAQDDDPKKQREAIERKRRRAWEAYLDEIISKEEFKQTAIRLDAQLAALPVAPIIDEDAPRKMRQAMPDGWRALYFELDGAHKKQFWAGILERIEITPGRDLRVVLRGTGAESAFNTRIQQPDGYWVEIIKAKE